jgi:cardiolipin synthase
VTDAAPLPEIRELAGRAFSRAAGAPLISGNHVRLLADARENYPAWHEAIRAARRRVLFESYFVCEDETGNELADALIAKAREGVDVKLLYDWLGSFGKASRRFWARLRAGGVDVRAYNSPQFDSPLGWLSRDHRKTLSVDGEVAFVTGLCVGRSWVGDPARGVEPWRDTGIEVHGPAVIEVEHAFAQIWALTGSAMKPSESAPAAPAGSVDMRIVASEPASAAMIRLDQLVAALARRRLWLTDAYYAGTTPYVQALRAAARDGVDVRLLVPNATDIPLLRPLSRAGYRPLLEAGVRVFEWNGTMLHAKTAVADGHWARVGSTNLNVASWFGNCELDAVVENEAFAGEMEAMYLADLENATEVVLDRRRRLTAPGEPRRRRGMRTSGGGSAGRAAAGAIRVGNTIGAAFTNRRLLGPVEARLATMSGVGACVLATVAAVFPRALAYPFALLTAWAGVALLHRAYRLRRQRASQRELGPPPAVVERR